MMKIWSNYGEMKKNPWIWGASFFQTHPNHRESVGMLGELGFSETCSFGGVQIEIQRLPWIDPVESMDT